MQKETWIAGTLDGTAVHETPKLAVPKEKMNARNMCLSKNDLLRMQIELCI